MKLCIAVLAAIALLVSPSYSFPQELPKTPEEALAKVNELVPGLNLNNLNVSSLNLGNLDLNKLNLGNISVSELAKPISEAENILRRKCEKNGGSYDAAKKAATDLFACTHGLVNVTKLKEEMDKARPTGDLDEVFAKYCAKKPILYKCLNEFSDSIEPCLEPIERENKKIVKNITEKVLDFVCFKEGDRIALFVAAKGPECFQTKAPSIGECVNATYGSYKGDIPFNPAEGLTGLANKIAEIKDLPPFVFDSKACNNMKELQTCSVNKLEGCEDPTPANLLDSIFNYIKKVTPCDEILKKKN